MRLHALFVLQQLVSDSNGQSAVCAAGAAPSLVKLSDGAGRDAAIDILCRLCTQSQELPGLIAAGVVAPRLWGEQRRGAGGGARCGSASGSRAAGKSS